MPFNDQLSSLAAQPISAAEGGSSPLPVALSETAVPGRGLGAKSAWSAMLYGIHQPLRCSEELFL
jgi:hypothetical protein